MLALKALDRGNAQVIDTRVRENVFTLLFIEFVSFPNLIRVVLANSQLDENAPTPQPHRSFYFLVLEPLQESSLLVFVFHMEPTTDGD